VALSVFAAGLLSSLLSVVPGGAFQLLGGLLILSAIVPTRHLMTMTGKKAVATS
jgi:hypothetical protein